MNVFAGLSAAEARVLVGLENIGRVFTKEERDLCAALQAKERSAIERIKASAVGAFVATHAHAIFLSAGFLAGVAFGRAV